MFFVDKIISKFSCQSVRVVLERIKATTALTMCPMQAQYSRLLQTAQLRNLTRTLSNIARSDVLFRILALVQSQSAYPSLFSTDERIHSILILSLFMTTLVSFKRLVLLFLFTTEDGSRWKCRFCGWLATWRSAYSKLYTQIRTHQKTDIGSHLSLLKNCTYNMTSSLSCPGKPIASLRSLSVFYFDQHRRHFTRMGVFDGTSCENPSPRMH